MTASWDSEVEGRCGWRFGMAEGVGFAERPVIVDNAEISICTKLSQAAQKLSALQNNSPCLIDLGAKPAEG